MGRAVGIGDEAAHFGMIGLTEEQQLMIDLFSSVNADNRAWVLEYCRRLKKVQEMEDVLSS